jgi:hypothetical protein
MMAQPAADADFFYHLTRAEIARKIKLNGMTTAETRIGIRVANPVGAFNQNRQEKEAEKQEQKLREFLGDIVCRIPQYDLNKCRNTLTTIANTPGVYAPFNYDPQGSNAVDVPALENLVSQRQNQYRQLVNLNGPRNGQVFRGLRNVVEIQTCATDLLRHRKAHFLSRLAVQAVAFQYKIEENITAAHVYFLKPQDAVVGYNDYARHLNANEIVVLRVNQANIADRVPDDSDHRAVMVPRTVPANVLEIMANCANFTDINYRTNAANWQALTGWN